MDDFIEYAPMIGFLAMVVIVVVSLYRHHKYLERRLDDLARDMA